MTGYNRIMRIFWTRVLLVLVLLLLAACVQYPVDFSDPSVLRGTLTGTLNSVCAVRVWKMAWSPDGQEIATIDSRMGGRLTIWDNQTGAELSFVDHLGLTYGVHVLNWSADGKKVFYYDAVDAAPKLNVFNVESKVLEAPIVLENAQNYWISQISADGSHVLGYFTNQVQGAPNPTAVNVRIWETGTGLVLFSKHFDIATSPSLALSDEGKEFAIWFDGKLQTWTLGNLKTHEWQLLGSGLNALAYSNHDQSINAIVSIMNYQISQFVRFDKSSSEVKSQAIFNSFYFLDFSDDGKFASLSSKNILNLETGVLSQINLSDEFSFPGLFSPDGLSLLYNSEQSCTFKRITPDSAEVREFILEARDVRPITLQLTATWQDKKQYVITGTASVDNQTGLTVTGTGFAADDEYFVNPRTPALRPRRAELKLLNTSGVQVGFAMVWGYLSNGEPNTFRGEFYTNLVSDPYFRLVLKRIP
jgi:WD40 repeat protein